MFLSRVVDKDSKKRPDAKAFVRGLWQAVAVSSQKSEADPLVNPGRESHGESSLDVLEKFYKKFDRDERLEFYLELDDEDRRLLLWDLTLGYCLDLYQSLESQKNQKGQEKQRNQKDQGCDKHIELYKMLSSKQQRKIYKMLEPRQQEELFKEIMDRELYNIDIEGPKGFTKLYKILKPEHQDKLFGKIMDSGLYNIYNIDLDVERQKELTKLYKILKPEHQGLFARDLKDGDVKWLYLSIKGQRGQIKLYNMLEYDKKKGLASGLASGLGSEDVRDLYLSLVDQAARGKIVHVYENQEGHIALYNMLEYDKKKELTATLGDYYLLNLYRDLKDQGERTRAV